jgi:site-specific DNA-methyltransferase (adenine-specific)
MMSNIKLLQGDCLELMKDLPDKSVDMILCDLPYEVTSQNNWDKKLPLDQLWLQYSRIAKETTPILLFAQGRFTAELIMSNLQDFKYTLVWDKVLPSGFLNANKQPLRTHEDIVVFYQSQCTYNPQKIKGNACHSRGYGVGSAGSGSNYNEYNMVETVGDDKFPTSVLSFSKPHASTALHPTQKPVELLEYLLRTYTNEGDTVLDNCMGSGSTGVASVNTNRNFIGMELDEEYFKIASERIQQAQKFPGTVYKKPKLSDSKKLF